MKTKEKFNEDCLHKTNERYKNYKDGSTVSAARTELSGSYAAKDKIKEISTTKIYVLISMN